MASSLKVTTKIQGDKKIVTAEVLPGGILPRAIFLYENTGKGQHGPYIGVCNKDELVRFKEWNPSIPTPMFGNRYVRKNEGVHVLSALESENQVISIFEKDAKALSVELQSIPVKTQVISIP